MKEITIEDSNNNQHTFELAENMRELPLSNKIAFDTCNEDIALWMKKCLEDDSLMENRTYYLYLLSRSVSEFIGYPLESVMSFDASDLVDEEGNLMPNVIEKHFQELMSKDIETDLDSVDLNLSQLHTYMVQLCKDYKFEFKNKKNCEIEYAGSIWEIPYVVKKLYSGKEIFSKVSIGQALALFKIKKHLKSFVKEDRDLADSDAIKNFRYTSFLKIIAATLTKKDEEYPLDETAFDAIITERLTIFQEIDTQSAYDIIFFLIDTMRS